MRIVIDANMVIAALVKDSKSREIIANRNFEFISPDFLLGEIRKHESYICEKSRLSKEELGLLVSLLLEHIKIIAASEYEESINTAKEIMKEDIKDVPYVACYMALKCDGIWTNDTDYDNKNQIKVLKTKDLIKLI